jgi:hypothetical protein
MKRIGPSHQGFRKGELNMFTATSDNNGESLTIDKLHKMLELCIPETPLFFSSEVIDPDDCYAMQPAKVAFYSMAHLFNDKNPKQCYVCGVNVRDALIKKGVAFENYPKPEQEKEK